MFTLELKKKRKKLENDMEKCVKSFLQKVKDCKEQTKQQFKNLKDGVRQQKIQLTETLSRLENFKEELENAAIDKLEPEKEKENLLKILAVKKDEVLGSNNDVLDVIQKFGTTNKDLLKDLSKYLVIDDPTALT